MLNLKLARREALRAARNAAFEGNGYLAQAWVDRANSFYPVTPQQLWLVQNLLDLYYRVNEKEVNPDGTYPIVGGGKMTRAYFFYPKEGEPIPEGAQPIVGTFFCEADVQDVYENMADESGEYLSWEDLPEEQRKRYLEKASKYLENACTYDWVDVVEQAITDADNPL